MRGVLESKQGLIQSTLLLRFICECCVVRVCGSYHDGEGESHDVDGPQGAEAGQNGQDQVVSGLRPVHGSLWAGAGLPGQRGSGRTTRHRPRPAARPRAVSSVFRGGGGGVPHHRADTVTWTDRREDIILFLLFCIFQTFRVFCR